MKRGFKGANVCRFVALFHAHGLLIRVKYDFGNTAVKDNSIFGKLQKDCLNID